MRMLKMIVAIVLLSSCALCVSGDIVTDGLNWNWTADEAPNYATNQWINTGATAGWTITFGQYVSKTDVNDAGVSFTNSYSFPAATGSSGSYSYLSGSTANSASFEIWFKPSTVSGNQMIYEAGGGVEGFSFALYDDTLKFESETDAGFRSLEKTGIGTDWQQVVGIFDQNTASDEPSFFLYHNGYLVGSIDGRIRDFCGSNDAGIGQVAGNTAANNGSWSGGSFSGEISIIRGYNVDLGEDGVLQNYNAIIPEPATFGIIGLFGIAYLLRRRLMGK